MVVLYEPKALSIGLSLLIFHFCSLESSSLVIIHVWYACQRAATESEKDDRKTPEDGRGMAHPFQSQ